MLQKLKEPTKKSGRRGNNEGTVFQRKDGRWCGQVTTGYRDDGKPVRKIVYGSSQKEVVKKVVALADDVFARGYTSGQEAYDVVRKLEPTMSEWFDAFAVPSLSSYTEANRRAMLKNHIFKHLGDYDIRYITVERLQRFFNNQVKAGICRDTIGKMKGLLSRFFAYAVKKGFISENPVSDVVIRKTTGAVEGSHRSGKALRQEIRKDVFTWMAENPVFKPIALTFSFTGLRPQELIALEWRHVNLDKRTISVKQAVNRVVEFDEMGAVVSRSEEIGTTKTRKSVRTLVIPAVVVEVLSEWQQYCKENGIVSEYVFPNTKTGGLRTYSGLRSLLMRFIRAHGLEDEGISLYTFRHTFATMLLEERENPRIVADMMGHVKVSTTLDIYSQVVSSTVYERTAQTLDGVFKKYS